MESEAHSLANHIHTSFPRHHIVLTYKTQQKNRVFTASLLQKEIEMHVCMHKYIQDIPASPFPFRATDVLRHYCSVL